MAQAEKPSFSVDYINSAPRDGSSIILGYYKEKSRKNTTVSDAVVFVAASWKPRMVWNNDSNAWEEHRHADTDGSWVDYANRLLVKVAETSGETGNFPRYWSPIPSKWRDITEAPRNGDYILLMYDRAFVENSAWTVGYIQAKWKPRKVWSNQERTWITSLQGVPLGEWVDYSNRVLSKSWATTEGRSTIVGWLPLPEVIENI